MGKVMSESVQPLNCGFAACHVHRQPCPNAGATRILYYLEAEVHAAVMHDHGMRHLVQPRQGRHIFLSLVK